MFKKNKTLIVSLLSILIGFAVGLIMILMSGKTPAVMLQVMIKGFVGFDITAPSKGINFKIVCDMLYYTAPLILTGLAVAFAYRTGLFNIGGEGQFCMGYFACTWCALNLNLPKFILPFVCILAAVIFSSLWAFLPGYLKAKRGVSEVIICIMMNYIGLYFSNFLTMNLLPLSENLKTTIQFPEAALLTKISSTASKLNVGLFVALIAVIIFHIIIEKTTFGYSLKATGFNGEGARYAGMKTERNIVLSMMVSGAFVGLAAGIVCLGSYSSGRVFAAMDNYGFNGICVALVGAANAFGVTFAGLLFGFLKNCQTYFQVNGISSEIADIIQAIIVFMVSIQYVLIVVMDKIDKKKGAK